MRWVLLRLVMRWMLEKFSQPQCNVRLNYAYSASTMT